ncbi:hypothetical protein M5D96_013265 [Drosophila gunungcola]|uniref:Translation elongation factor EF1B beta/delta subunit guanine nucleotide exchange domain-containing protein n=1 Tax=Drosophila gunungcola TaxID=103775 RepID=A0A9P9YBV4_9MUSC|nr:hypothetical protein M5D96_013265 [Drosophila gunungcola]
MKELNNFLADNSYISGYTPSKADLSVLEALGKAPAADNAAERAAWTGAPLPQLAGGKPTVAAAPAKPAAADDDDDDDKVSIDLLQEKIEEFEDFVQSVDIAAFNKI